MVLELLYFDGCPSWHQALENLRQALTLHGLDMEVSLIEVKDQANADELRFQGPPRPSGSPATTCFPRTRTSMGSAVGCSRRRRG